MSKLVVKTDGLLETVREDVTVLESAGLRFAEGTYLTEDELIEHCRDADGLLVLREPITERVLASLPNLAVISRFGVGLDTVDVEAATRQGVVVTNVPDSNVHEVATHAVTLAASLVRRIGDYDASVRRGEWAFRQAGRPVHRLTTLRFGVLGLGQIGRCVATMAAALGFRVQAHDPTLAGRSNGPDGVPLAAFDELVETSDVLSVHVPLTDATRNLIDAGVMARMPDGAALINVSRGGIVDEAALVRALDSGQIGSAGLDTFAQEPLDADSPLLERSDVILTPHTAHYSIESYAEVRRKAFEDAALVLSGHAPRYPVN